MVMLTNDGAGYPCILHGGKRVTLVTLPSWAETMVRQYGVQDFWRRCSRLEHRLLRSLQDDLIKTCQDPPSLLRYFELMVATMVLLLFHHLLKYHFPQKVRTKIPYKSTLGGTWT